jgi:type II secretory pathway pseudopilin PulG
MVTRARKNPSDEDGFIIIEVLVSALILAIVAGAVLTLIVATTRGAAVQRDRAVANDVAQADQARLRNQPIYEIAGNQPEDHEYTRGGMVFNVHSEREYVNNKAGAVSCTGGSNTPDYVKLTSTVSSATTDHPVVMQSVVSPSTGSLNTAYGTLQVPTKNAAGGPVGGVSVSANGRTATSGSEGCVNFVSMPSGSSEVLYNGHGLINESGEEKPTQSVSVAGGKIPSQPTTPFKWDYPATIEAKFTYLEPGTGKEWPAPVDSMYFVNAISGQPGRWTGTPGGVTRSSTQIAGNVFPFKSSEYVAFAGSCASNNPGTSSTNKVGLFSGELVPKGKATPTIRVPALEVTVTTKSGKEGKEGTVQIVSGAKVTLTDRNCKFNGINVKRTYTTTMAGHLSNEAAVKQEVATKELPTKVLAPVESGVPFGTYEICASATINGEARYAKLAEQKVEDFTSKGTVVTLNLTKTTAC